MLQVFNLLLPLLLAMASVRPVFTRPANTECSQHYHDYYYYDSPYFDSGYTYLYLKLEKALINDQKTLNELRAGFISDEENIMVHIYNFQLEVVNGTSNDGCSGYYDSHSKTFCNSDYMWKLCDGLDMTYSSQSYDAIQYENHKHIISNSNIWLFLIHGSTTPAFITVVLYDAYSFNLEQYGSIWDVTLRIDELKCNPSLELTKCILSELFSWVKVYSYTEAGSKPLTWDQNERGSISFEEDDYNDDDTVIMEFWKWSISAKIFVQLALTEYAFVSLSLALVIAKFFPAIHSQIVTKAASSLEYQSLYWGSAVVANVFTYGLVFLAGKGIFTPLQCIYYPTVTVTNVTSPYRKCIESFYIIFSIMQLVVYLVLFSGALIASLRSPRGVPMPTGIGKVMINISFCFSCFCFCVCCSPRCRAKTLEVLIMFSFMSFIYHSIMDAISIVFILFDEEYRTLFITLTLLYISLIMFIVIFISFSLYLVFCGREKPFHKQIFSCCGGSLMLVTVFGAVILVVVMYMIIFFSLKPTGISGIASGLVPSIALSAATWCIKKKLLKENNPSTTSAEAECDYREPAVNGGGMEVAADSSTEEGRHLLQELA